MALLLWPWSRDLSHTPHFLYPVQAPCPRQWTSLCGTISAKSSSALWTQPPGFEKCCWGKRHHTTLEMDGAQQVQFPPSSGTSRLTREVCEWSWPGCSLAQCPCRLEESLPATQTRTRIHPQVHRISSLIQVILNSLRCLYNLHSVISIFILHLGGALVKTAEEQSWRILSSMSYNKLTIPFTWLWQTAC